MYFIGIDGTRLMDQCKEVEARRTRLESDSRTFPFESWFGCGALGPGRDQSFSNGGCFPVPTPRMDASGREAGARKSST